MTVDITNLTFAGPREQQARRMTSARQFEQLVDVLAAAVAPVLERWSAWMRGGKDLDLTSEIAGFYSLYDSRPVRDNSGGSGFNDSLWLFLLTRAVAPERIIESGVHKGHSTWIFRQAAPEAEILSFDIDLSKRVYHDEKACYFEHDWTGEPLEALTSGRDLLFLDDHINHARRLQEAKERGFRYAVLDDNFAAWNLYATGGPPVPTLAMLQDETLDPVSPIEWMRNGKVYRYHPDMEEISAVREIIERAETLPDLAPLTRASLGSQLSLVKLVS